MILPIRAYGDSILRKKTIDITSEYPELKDLIDNMFETMKNAYGIGLAAPQIGLNIRLFIVDASPLAEDKEYKAIAKDLKTFKRIFINPKITNEEGTAWKFNEGCLSIPGIREDVERLDTITIEYLDENFKPLKETFSDVRARIIQHEYDHIEGILFTDYVSSLKKKLLKKKLNNITTGNVEVDYRMKFPKK